MEILQVQTQRALSLTQIELADYVINPFKGCLVGCRYCYARSNRQIQRIAKPWGEYLYIKENFLAQLEKELGKSGPIKRVLIGSTTEPFQPLKQAQDLTRGILELLAHRTIPCVILTKSALVADFLPALQYSPANKIYLTCNSPLVRERFELQSSPQAERIEAAGILTRGGVDTTVYISPVFPGLSDIPLLLKKLQGCTTQVSFESYNPKLGNWTELAPGLPPPVLEEIRRIYACRESYTDYWEQFRNEVSSLNKTYNYRLQFFIYPYNSYYNSP